MNDKAIFAVFCFVLALALSACLSADDEIQRNKELASEIIPAIEAYLDEHGHYPEDLDDVVPKYIVELPKTVGGGDFLYLVISSSDYYPGRFVLGFELVSRSNMGCGYNSKYEKWECGFGD